MKTEIKYLLREIIIYLAYLIKVYLVSMLLDMFVEQRLLLELDIYTKLITTIISIVFVLLFDYVHTLEHIKIIKRIKNGVRKWKVNIKELHDYKIKL